MGAFGHISFLILTIIFPPMIVLWVICALCCGASKRNKMQCTLEQQNELLRDIKQQNMYRGYRD